MSIDVFTKKSSLMGELNINPKINQEVYKLYLKYKVECTPYLWTISNANTTVHRYYVYAWYAKNAANNYFYVGKGTGKRYNHILADIEKYKKGKYNIRYQRYSEIQDKWGIDYKILLDGLTEYEALIYEECIKLDFLKKGEALLNVEGVPEQYLPQGWLVSKDSNTPTLLSDSVYRKFICDMGAPYFDDVVETDLMKTYVYPYFVDCCDPTVILDMTLIYDWLNTHNAKVYKTCSKNTTSVIVFGNLRYDKYTEFRNNSKKILSSKDIVDFIS